MTIKTFCLLLAIITVSCKQYSDDKIEDLKKTTFTLDFPSRKYVAIQQGQKITLYYKIKNEGDEILFISNVQTSCGCLTSTYPTSPISSGNRGIIKLEFDSTKSMGYVEHYFTIVANTDKVYNEYKFEINVVPNSQHIKDYEEIYNENLENNTIKEAVDGDNTEKKFNTK